MFRPLRHALSTLTLAVLTATLAPVAEPARADIPSSLGTLNVTPMATGLREPWAVAFLPGGGFLVTERGGRLWRFDAEGRKTRIGGVPRVAANGQGGLLDVVVARNFAQTREIFLSYAKQQSGGAGTAVAVAKLSGDGRNLTNVREIFEMAPGFSGGRHFGSRIVEGRDGHLYVTLGERGKRPSAQNLANHNGTVVRIKRTGGAAPGNPFAGRDGAQPEIWSYGHRNPQGAALDGSGRLWVVEHGAKGGDEVNLVQKGANYGWPVISYGRHYSGQKIGEGTSKPGMKQPALYWDPSIAPSGMMIYSGAMFPEWKGDIFVGSLKFDYIERLNLSGTRVSRGEVLESGETERVRDVREAPDGSIWFISVGNGAVYRMAR